MYRTVKYFSYTGIRACRMPSKIIVPVQCRPNTVYLSAHYHVEMDYSRKKRVLEFPMRPRATAQEACWDIRHDSIYACRYQFKM